MKPDKQQQAEQRLAVRTAALDGVPHALPPVKREERDGKLYLTVRFKRPSWQRLLGADAQCERTFGIDSYGRQVYENCDGRKTVKDIVRLFATHTHVSIPEAELAVTRFMRTLLAKGLVAMEMEKGRIGR